MTDHLEPYRRMARSIKFFPPVSLTQPSPQSVAEPLTLPPVSVSSSKRLTEPEGISPAKPPLDPSEQAAALVKEAVSKATVLPVSYTVLENIGDRISRLTSPKPVESHLIQPKIPQPDPNWTSTPPAIDSAINRSEQIAALVQEAVSKPTVVPSSYTILEDIGDRISQLASPKTVDTEPVVPQVSQPTTAKGTFVDLSEPQPKPEDTSPDDKSEPQLIGVDPKKFLDDTHRESAASATVVPETPLVEESHRNDSDAGVVEPLEVEKTPDEASIVGVVESVAVGEAEEVENAQAPTLWDRVSSAIEAVSTTFKNPDTNPNSSESVEEPYLSNSTVTEAPVDDRVEPLTTDALTEDAENVHAPSFLDRVSSLVEAVATSFKDIDTPNKNSEVEVASTTAEPVSDSKTLPATCPSCASTDLRENGQRQGKQKYVCNSCGNQFTIPDSIEAQEQSKEASSQVETSTVKASERNTEVVDRSSELSKPHSKKKGKAKGFGNPKAKKP